MLPPRTSSISVHPLPNAPTGPEALSNATKRGPLKVMLFVEGASVNGAAKSLLNFCDTLIDLAAPVSLSIATFHRGVVRCDDSPNEFVEAVKKRGITTFVIPERRRFDHQLFRSIRAVVHRASPDILQTNNVKSHFLIKAAGVERQCRWIACHHGYTTTDFKVKCYNQLDRWSLRSAERVITVCKAFEPQLSAAGVASQKLRIVHNSGNLIPRLPASDLESFKSRLGIGGDVTILLSIGRLSYEKGHADLLGAAHVLKQLRPSLNFKLVVVGFGPERARLAAQADRLGLRSSVVFACNEPDVTPFYNVADVFVLSSHSEGSPHVLFEAMGAGVPIVATRVGGIPEILHHGETALLAPASQPRALAAAIARMLDSKQVAQGYANRAKSVLADRHSPEAYARSVLGVYAEVMQAEVTQQRAGSLS